MTESCYEKILELETTPESLDATVAYLTRQMKPFLKTLEPVLICIPDDGPASLGGLFKEAVLRCEATPVFWGPDYRWKELLRIAFDTHANTVIAPPLIVLGLMKLAKATETPLYIFDVIAGGDPFPRWIVNDLKKGFDCNTWGCYAINSGPVVAGFSCTQEAGIHIREEVIRPHLVRDSGEKSAPNWGKLYFTSAKNPDLIYDPEQDALLQYQPCSCGCDEVRVVEACSRRKDNRSTEYLLEQLLSWSSVLDYRVTNTESGLNLELVVFPGKLLPKLPSCARLTVRPWDPEQDIPFIIREERTKIPENSL